MKHLNEGRPHLPYRGVTHSPLKEGICNSSLRFPMLFFVLFVRLDRMRREATQKTEKPVNFSFTTSVLTSVKPFEPPQTSSCARYDTFMFTGLLARYFPQSRPLRAFIIIGTYLGVGPLEPYFLAINKAAHRWKCKSGSNLEAKVIKQRR